MLPRSVLSLLVLFTLLMLSISACTSAADLDPDAERTRVAATIYAEQAGQGASPVASTPLPTATPTATPTSTPAPVPAGFPVPLPSEPISLSSVDRVEQLARWGSGAISQIAVSSQSGFAVVASALGLDVYHGAGFEPLYHLETEDEAQAAAVSEETDTLAFVVGDQLHIARLSTGEPVADLPFWGEGGAARLLFSPNGEFLAIWQDLRSEAWTIQVLRSQDWESAQQLDVEGGYIMGVDFSPQSDYLVAAGGYEGGVYIWQLSTGMLVEKIDEWYVEDIDGAFSPTTAAFIMHMYSEFALIDLERGLPIVTLADPPLFAYDRAFSPDGRFLYLGGESREDDDGLLLAWDTQTGDSRQVAVRDWVTNMSISPDGQTLAGVTRDGTIQLWQADGIDLRPRGELALPRAERAVLTGDGLLIGVTSDGVLSAWTVEDRQLVRTVGGAGLSGPLSDVAFSHGGTYVAAGSSNGNVAVWRAADGEILLTAAHAQGDLLSLQVGFSHDEGMLVAVDDSYVSRWSLPDGEARRPLELRNESYSYTGPQYTAALVDTADELILLMNGTEYEELSCLGGGLRLRRDTLSVRLAGYLTVLREFPCLAVDANDVRLSPDRTLLFTRSDPNGEQACQGDPYEVIQVYGRRMCVPLPTATPPASDGQPLISAWSWDGGAPLRSHSVVGPSWYRVWEVSPSGSYLAALSNDGLDILDLSNWELIQRIPIPCQPDSYDSGQLVCYESAQALAFSTDETLIAGALGADILVWDIRTGQIVRTLSGHLAAVTALDFADDGLLLASASEDGTVRLWGVR